MKSNLLSQESDFLIPIWTPIPELLLFCLGQDNFFWFMRSWPFWDGFAFNTDTTTLVRLDSFLAHKFLLQELVRRGVGLACLNFATTTGHIMSLLVALQS